MKKNLIINHIVVLNQYREWSDMSAEKEVMQ